jgi:hypothetical protein
VSRALREGGAADATVAAATRSQLVTSGFSVAIPDPSSHVFVIE